MNKKQVLRAVRDNLPSLLGFECASIYMHDSWNKSLYTISIDEEAEKIMKEKSGGSFEVDFAFDSK